jgi:hypothetical protein
MAYLRSGGYPGIAREYGFAEESASYSITSRGVSYLAEDSPEIKLLKSMYDWLSLRITASNHPLSYLSQFNNLFPLADVIRELSDGYGTAYNLADYGIVRLVEAVSSANDGARIGLGGAAIYFDLALRFSQTTLTPVQLFAMGAKSPPFEQIALEILAGKAQAWLGFPLLTSTVDIFRLPKGASEPRDLDSYKLQLFKEAYDGDKDSFGVDAFVLQPTDEKHLVVHRMQLKIGSRNMRDTELKEVGEKWRRHQKQVSKICKNLFPGFTASFRYYFVTTQGIKPDLIKGFEETYDAKFFGKRHLAENVWPPILGSVAEFYRCGNSEKLAIQ